MPEAPSQIDKLSIDTVRALAMDAVQKANSGHPGTAMALAPLGYLSVLVQRFTVNPMAMVSPLRSAADVIRDIRTRGEI